MNHTSDERFAFLRGRWKLTWERTKKDAKAKQDLLSGKSEKEKKSVGSLIGGYESSDDDEDEEQRPPALSPPPPPPPDVDIPPLPDDQYSDTARQNDHIHSDSGTEVSLAEAEEERQRLRRIKAEEWKKKRAGVKS